MLCAYCCACGTVPLPVRTSYALRTQVDASGREKKRIKSDIIVLQITDVKDYVINDVLGPLVRKAMSRKRKKLPISVKAPIMRRLYQDLFTEDLIVEDSKVANLFGEWARRNFKLGSYAVMCSPVTITQDVISKTSTNVIIQFSYKVYNGFGVLQWPRTPGKQQLLV